MIRCESSGVGDEGENMKATITLKNEKTGEIIEQEYGFSTVGSRRPVIADAQLAYLTGGRRVEHATVEKIAVRTDDGECVAVAERRMVESLGTFGLCTI
jgi:hypothetical protein